MSLTRDVIKPFLNLFNTRKIIKELEKDKEKLHEYITNLRDMINYKKIILYNPVGEDLQMELPNNVVYIQGKPKWIKAFGVDDVIVLNKSKLDKEYFDVALGSYKVNNPT